jgi:hypothetical protein
MVQVQSKLMPITTTCIEYVHPWSNSCSIATAELLVVSAQDSFRIYSVVYLVSGRITNSKKRRQLKFTFLAVTVDETTKTNTDGSQKDN